MSVGSRVVGYHDGVLCGEADVFALVDLFYRAVECRAQTVGGIASSLCETYSCCATFGVGSVDGHAFLVCFVGFGQAGSFVLCKGDAVVEDQIIAIAQSPERLFNMLSACYFCSRRCSFGSGGRMVLSSSLSGGGPLML